MHHTLLCLEKYALCEKLLTNLLLWILRIICVCVVIWLSKLFVGLVCLSTYKVFNCYLCIFILCNSLYLYPIGLKTLSFFTVCETGKRKKCERQTYTRQILWHHGLRLWVYHILIFYSFGVWSNECKLFNKYVNHFP